MLAEWFLIISLHHNYAAIDSIPMQSYAACEKAGKAWQELLDTKRAQYVCVKASE